jgi:hypothetical protein
MNIMPHTFRQEEIAQLRHYHDTQRDRRLKLRFLGLVMLAEHIPLVQVASIIGKNEKTFLTRGRQYLTRGIDSLTAFNYRPKQATLNPHQVKQLVT